MLKKYLRKNTIGYIVLISAAAATLLLVGIVTKSEKVTEWNLLKTPEATFELYFTNHELLSSKYTPEGRSIVSFTVVSHDTMQTLYPYEITQQDMSTGAVKLLSSGEIRLENNHTTAQEVPIIYADSSRRSQITVCFPEQRQSIHYWVEKQ